MNNLDFSQQPSEYKLLKNLAKPFLIDTTNPVIIYEGHKFGELCHICKIDCSTPIISRTWATGAWADRTTLNYI